MGEIRMTRELQEEGRTTHSSRQSREGGGEEGGRRPTKQSHHADIVSSEMGARKRDCFAEFTLGLAEGETRGLVMTSYSAASAGAVTSAGKTISATGGGSRLGALSLSPTRASVARACSASRWRFHIEA